MMEIDKMVDEVGQFSVEKLYLEVILQVQWVYFM